MQQLWQAVQAWLDGHHTEFWIGLGLLAGMWVIFTLVMEYRWTREQDGKLLFGYSPRLKLLWALPTLLLLLGVVTGITHALGQAGGFAAVGAFILLTVVWAVALALLLAVAFGLFRRKHLELDFASQSWRLERGWAFAPESRVGDFQAIDHLLLERVETWRYITWRISVIWKGGVRPFVLFERRLKRTPLAGRLLLLLLGMHRITAAAEENLRSDALKRLQVLGGKLVLPTVIQPVSSK